MVDADDIWGDNDPDTLSSEDIYGEDGSNESKDPTVTLFGRSTGKETFLDDPEDIDPDQDIFGELFDNGNRVYSGRDDTVMSKAKVGRGPTSYQEFALSPDAGTLEDLGDAFLGRIDDCPHTRYSMPNCDAAEGRGDTAFGILNPDAGSMRDEDVEYIEDRLENPRTDEPVRVAIPGSDYSQIGAVAAFLDEEFPNYSIAQKADLSYVPFAEKDEADIVVDRGFVETTANDDGDRISYDVKGPVPLEDGLPYDPSHPDAEKRNYGPPSEGENTEGCLERLRDMF
jgi:hypothetical protein